MLAKRGNELLEILDYAKFRIALLKTTNVLAVTAAGSGLEKR